MRHHRIRERNADVQPWQKRCMVPESAALLLSSLASKARCGGRSGRQNGRATRWQGRAEFIDQSGFVNLVVDDERPANELHRSAGVRAASSSRVRAWWRCRHCSWSVTTGCLPSSSRWWRAAGVSIRSGMRRPIPTEGKALAGLIKALTRPLESALRKRGALPAQGRWGVVCICFWMDGESRAVGHELSG